MLVPVAAKTDCCFLLILSVLWFWMTFSCSQFLLLVQTIGSSKISPTEKTLALDLFLFFYSYSKLNFILIQLSNDNRSDYINTQLVSWCHFIDVIISWAAELNCWFIYLFIFLWNNTNPSVLCRRRPTEVSRFLPNKKRQQVLSDLFHNFNQNYCSI